MILYKIQKTAKLKNVAEAAVQNFPNNTRDFFTTLKVLGGSDGSQIFKIRDFLKNGTFLKDFSTENISCFLKENSNESFGKDIVMYYFYFKGYDISFIYDESKGILKGEQIEISNHKKIKSKRISSILTFENLKLSKLNGDIHSIYQDDDELVVFLQNGLNLYYNKFNKKKFLLTKIISPDENSRKLVKSTMNLCSKN